MTELLANNNFTTPGDGNFEAAAFWEGSRPAQTDARRVQPAVAGIPAAPSGNTWVIQISNAVDNLVTGMVSQSGVPVIAGQSYTLTFNTLATGVVPEFDQDLSVAATAGGGFFPYTYPSLNTWYPISIPFTAINNGGTLSFTAYQIGTAYDRAVYIDQPSILAPLICYSGISQVLVKDIETNEIKELPVVEVDIAKHQVYDVAANAFIPILDNRRTGPTKEYVKIPQDSLGLGIPNRDFYLTRGHYLSIDGKEVKAKDVPTAIIEPAPRNEFVYSIITDPRTVIQVNGMAVFTYSPENWIKYLEARQAKSQE